MQVQTRQETVFEQEVCPPGFWCTAGKAVKCLRGYFNPHRGADNESACVRCPDHSTTRGEGTTQLTDCLCDVGYFNEDADAGLRCRTCVSGSNCTVLGVELAALPLKPGFFRISRDSYDLRRCPGPSLETTGCAGGSDFADQCRPGLAGIYCSRCANASGYYHVAGSSSSPAHCTPCSSIGVGLAVGGSLGLAAMVLLVVAANKSARALAFRRRAREVATRLTIPSKFRQLISFYQIAASIDSVYHVILPAAAKRLVDVIHVSITLGLDNIGVSLQV